MFTVHSDPHTGEFNAYCPKCGIELDTDAIIDAGLEKCPKCGVDLFEK